MKQTLITKSAQVGSMMINQVGENVNAISWCTTHSIGLKLPMSVALWVRNSVK
jgi:hypothetical protein